MRRSLFRPRRQNVLSNLLLVALLFRAYVPVGFMPALGTPFLLQLCPAAASVPMAAQHHHESATHGHFEHCPFGSAPAGGPISQLIAFDRPAPAVSHHFVVSESQRFGIRLPNAHQPRGPPSPV